MKSVLEEEAKRRGRAKCSYCKKGRPSHFFYDAKSKSMKALCEWCYSNGLIRSEIINEV